MLITLLLLVVPATALAMVLGMGHLEDSLLRHPSVDPVEVEGAVSR